MSSKFTALDDELYSYLLGHSLRDTDLYRRLREETAKHPYAAMQVAPEQAQLLALLVQLCGARRAIEIGVFTGYSALAIAGALPEDGVLIACDSKPEYTDVAERYWSEAGLRERIDLRIGKADRTLETLLDGGQRSRFDFAFIDADKTGYRGYYEQCLELLRPGGLMVIDNVLWGGAVLEKFSDDEDTRSIQQLNKLIHEDQRVDIAMLPVADGLSLVRKR